MDDLARTKDAGKRLIDIILKQSEFLGSLSTAVFGACVVFIVWYVQRPNDKTHTSLPISNVLAVVCCLALQGFSIIFMYLGYGQIVTAISKISYLNVSSAAAFDKALPPEFHQARILFLCQFLAFLLGIALLAWFAWSNYRLFQAAAAVTPASDNSGVRTNSSVTSTEARMHNDGG